ncbi:UNVERIFIED_CONTAM: hypothetical protein FKN15_049324 [Acipenser sinensis]
MISKGIRDASAMINLGKSGLKVSCLGLGTWVTFGGQITDEMAEQLITLAYENGINLFDTAEVYAAGKAETERGLSRKHIIEGLKASLERLQLEYVDVVFANRPDPNTPMEGDPFSTPKSRTFIVEETVRAMTHVINQGMAMYWGTSRWSSMEIMASYSTLLSIPGLHLHPEAYSVARQFNQIPPICEQAEYHMFQREKVEVQLPELFHKIAWCLRNEGVSSVLLGASNTEQLMENIGAIQVLPKLSSSIVHEVDSILGNKPYIKKDYRS